LGVAPANLQHPPTSDRGFASCTQAARKVRTPASRWNPETLADKPSGTPGCRPWLFDRRTGTRNRFDSAPRHYEPRAWTDSPPVLPKPTRNSSNTQHRSATNPPKQLRNLSSPMRRLPDSQGESELQVILEVKNYYDSQPLGNPQPISNQKKTCKQYAMLWSF
jgi:hypothetical protein